MGIDGAEGADVLKMMVHRLNGIESELSALRGLMAQLVRVEERGNAVRAEVARVAGELATLRGEIGVLRERASRTGFTVGAVERVFWLVVAGLVAWLSGGGK